MTTWYMDYEAGTNANAGVGAGDSFATRRKTLDNFVAAALAPGDTIRVMGSPAPTSLGINATWTTGPLPATKAIVSSTNTTPISVKVTAHGFTTGDTIQIASHNINFSAVGTFEVTVTGPDDFTLDGSVPTAAGGATGTARKINNRVVRLAAPLTKPVSLNSDGRAVGAIAKNNWTPSANVTAAVQAVCKQGGEALQFSVAAGFATGLAAFALVDGGGTQDFSGYRGISFHIHQVSGTLLAAADMSIKLCSDVAGAVPVNTINIPAIPVLSRFNLVYVDTGGALGAAIKSVALYVNVDNGAQVVIIDNIQAIKSSASADSLNHASLLGKNVAGEYWWPIQSIMGTRVILDVSENSNPSDTSARGYYGTTETVATYKRETIKTIPANGASVDVQVMQDSGTAGNVISISGGWNRVDMSTQILETWFDGVNGFGRGIQPNVQSFLSFDKISGCRYSDFFQAAGGTFNSISNSEATCNTTSGYNLNNTALEDWSFSNIAAIANLTGGIIHGGPRASITAPFIALSNGNTSIATGRQNTGDAIVSKNGTATGVTIGTGSVFDAVTSSDNAGAGISLGVGAYIGTVVASGNATQGLVMSAYSTVKNATLNNNGTIGAQMNTQSLILGGSTSGNGASGVNAGNTTRSCLRNFTINEATEVAGFAVGSGAIVFSENHDNTPGNNVIFCDGGQIISQTAVRHTPSGYAWKLSPTSVERVSQYPLHLSLGQFACVADEQRTITCWVQKDNAGLTLRLVSKGGQLAGVPNDVIATATGASVGAWEQLQIQFTPTEAGVIEITAEAFGGTTFNGYVDDLGVA